MYQLLVVMMETLFYLTRLSKKHSNLIPPSPIQMNLLILEHSQTMNIFSPMQVRAKMKLKLRKSNVWKTCVLGILSGACVGTFIRWTEQSLCCKEVGEILSDRFEGKQCVTLVQESSEVCLNKVVLKVRGERGGGGV